MLVFVKTITGRIIRLEVEGSDSIEAFKVKLYDTERILPSYQRLIYAGKQLSDDYTVSDCGIHKESIVHLVFRTDSG
ncbi:hypothetical protein V3C99_008712 [Haemonchus contortus]